MDWRQCGKEQIGENSQEADFRAKLRRAQTEGKSTKETADELGMHPFLLGLVGKVICEGYLNKRYPIATRNEGRKNGAHAGNGQPPAATESKVKKEPVPLLVPDWEGYLRTNPELRDEWRHETLIRVARALVAGTILEKEKCDPEHPQLGGRFRRFCEFKAIKAQWQIWNERGFRFKQGVTPEADVTVRCLGVHMEDFPAEGRAREEALMDVRLDLAMAIDSLDDPRQREVMRLCEMGYSYEEIVAKASITKDQVRHARKKAIEAIRKRWGVG
jgi:DNA-binding CsgD family transcriptional regulator